MDTLDHEVEEYAALRRWLTRVKPTPLGRIFRRQIAHIDAKPGAFIAQLLLVGLAWCLFGVFLCLPWIVVDLGGPERLPHDVGAISPELLLKMVQKLSLPGQVLSGILAGWQTGRLLRF